MAAPAPAIAVKLAGVTKSFGDVVAVDDLSLAVPAGSLYGFIGPNGSGKMTTMRMIVNIFSPDRGSVRLFGETRLGARTEWIGYLPEERGLYEKMSVRSTLEFYGERRGGRNVASEVDEWLRKLGLDGAASLKVEALSKGMSQKARFIAAVAPQPKLLILDEPSTGLDPVSAQVLRSAILELRAGGSTIILSTHDQTRRLVEMLIGVATPMELMAGKVMAAVAVSLTRSAFYVDGGAFVLQGLGMAGLLPPGIFVWFFAYLSLDLTLLSAVAAALGALASTLQESPRLAIVVMAPVIIPLFLLVAILGQPNSVYSTVLSLFPLFTPVLMLARQAMPEGIPAWQPWVGLAGVLVAVPAIVWLAARVFRLGILLQGKAPRAADVLKWAHPGVGQPRRAAMR